MKPTINIDKMILNKKAILREMSKIAIKNVNIKNLFMFKDLNINLENKNLIVGCNGTGKTTFLKIIDRLINIIIDEDRGEYDEDIESYFENNKINGEDECYAKCTVNIKQDNILIWYMTVNIILQHIDTIKRNKKYIKIEEETIEKIKKIIMEKMEYIEIKYDAIKKKSDINGKSLNVIIMEAFQEVTEYIDIKSTEQKDKEENNVEIIKKYMKKLRELMDEKQYQNIMKKDDIERLRDEFLFGELKIGDDDSNMNLRARVEDIIEYQYCYIERENTITHDIFELYCKKKESIKVKSIEYNAKISRIIGKLNKDIGIKNTIMDMYKYNLDLYNKLNESYNNITNKNFIVKYIDDNNIDIEYYNIYKSKRYECSTGERNLIKILFELEFSDSNILMIDEPTVHLYSEYSIKMGELMSKYTEKQLIIVTHECNFINNKLLDNIIHMGFREKNHNILNLKPDENIKKLILENKSILFIDNIILVEGYYDLRLYNCLLNIISKKKNKHNIPIIISMNGKGSEIYKLLKKMNIKYAIIYDHDKVDETLSKVNNCPKNLLAKLIFDHKIVTDIPNIYEWLLFENMPSENISSYFKGRKMYVIHFFYRVISLLIKDNKEITKLINELPTNMGSEFNDKYSVYHNEITNKIFKLEVIKIQNILDVYEKHFLDIHNTLYNLYLIHMENQSTNEIYIKQNSFILNNIYYEDLFYDLIVQFYNKININTEQIHEVIDSIMSKSNIFILDKKSHDIEGFYNIHIETDENNKISKNKKKNWLKYDTEYLESKLQQSLDSNNKYLIKLYNFLDKYV